MKSLTVRQESFPTNLEVVISRPRKRDRIYYRPTLASEQRINQLLFNERDHSYIELDDGRLIVQLLFGTCVHCRKVVRGWSSCNNGCPREVCDRCAVQVDDGRFCQYCAKKMGLG